jgi:DNA-binding MarR family transcriptional regulator
VSTVESGAEQADYLTLDQQVCFALSVASRSVISLYRPLLEPLGLTHPQYLVMVALWEQEPLSVTELSRLLQLDPPSVSPVVKRLHAAGLVERHRDSQDERAVRLTLTPRGRALKERASTIPLAMAERLGMSVPELESIRTTLAHLISRAHGSSV